MFRGRFEITDGTNTIDLLGKNGGCFSVKEWIPATPAVKGDGIWLDNPLIDGRQLAIRKQQNIIENITLTVKGQSQTDIYSSMRSLRRMLEKATKYWTDPQRFASPVYLIIQYPEETTAYQATIYDYRMPVYADPWNTPMFPGSPTPVTDDFALTIEHGYRLPYNTSLCADLNYDYDILPISVDSFEPTQSEDDARVNTTTSSIVLASVGLIGNVGGYGSASDGIRFRNVTIPAGATILRARLAVVCTMPISQTPPEMIIEGEANIAPAVFSTYANYIARARTTAHVDVSNTDYDAVWGIGDTKYIPVAYGVEDVIQEIIDLPGWASGNDLVIFMTNACVAAGRFREFAMWDHITYDPPKLEVEYSLHTKTNSVDDSSCVGVIMSNEDKFSDVYDIQFYDDSLAAYTALTGTVLPWTLFPAVPDVDDMLYIACNLSPVTPPAEPFAQLIFNLTTGMTNATVEWEYYDGGAWTALVDMVDKTNGLSIAGMTDLHFRPIDNWAEVAVNGITAYWIRAKISASAGVITPPVQDTNEVQVGNRPYIDITTLPDSDAPCKLRITVTPRGSNAPTWPGGTYDDFAIDDVYVASRSIDRGSDFTPYINLPGGTPSGITPTSAGTANVFIPTSPTGIGLQFSPAGVDPETDRLIITLTAPAIDQYKGKFRALLRRYSVTDPERIGYRLRVATNLTGSTPAFFQTDIVTDVADTEHRVIDFGVISLTPPPGVVYETLYIIISTEVSGACEVSYEDLILLPADEMFIHAYQRIGDDVSNPVLTYDDMNIVMDGISGDELSAYAEKAGNVINPYLYETNSEFELDPYGGSKRIWFFVGTFYGCASDYKRSYSPVVGFSVTVEIQPRII